MGAILAVNYALQQMPLRDWLPRVFAAIAAVVVLLLLNLGWAGLAESVQSYATQVHAGRI